MDIRFGDHSSFHRAAAGMVGGSAALGLALHPLTPMAALVGGLFGIAVGTAFAYGRPKLRIASAAVAAVPLMVMAPTANATPTSTALALVAGVLAIGLTLGIRGIRGILM